MIGKGSFARKEFFCRKAPKFSSFSKKRNFQTLLADKFVLKHRISHKQTTMTEINIHALAGLLVWISPT
jgi:hypothetical protein